MKLFELYKVINSLAAAMPNINTVVEDGDIYRLNQMGTVRYCAFNTICTNHVQHKDEDYDEWTMTMFYVDRLLTDSSNKTLIQSNGDAFFVELCDKMDQLGITPVTDLAIDHFTERFTDECAGSMLTITLRTEICENSGYIFKKIEKNGLYNFTGFYEVLVNVSGSEKTEVDGEYTITSNGSEVFNPPTKSTFSSVTVHTNVPTYEEEYQEAQASISTLNAIIVQRNAQIASLNAEIAADEAEISRLEGIISNDQVIIAAKDATIASLNESIAAKDGEIVRLSEQVESLTNEVAAKTAIINELNEKINSVTSTTINSNGIFSPSEGVLGWNSVNVQVPSDKKPEEEISYSATANGDYAIEPEVTGEVIKKVNLTVAVPSDRKTEEEIEYSATANGSYTIEPEVSGEVIKKVDLTVNVPSDRKPEQEKSITIKQGDLGVAGASKTIEITPDEGSVLSKATVSFRSVNLTKAQVFTPEDGSLDYTFQLPDDSNYILHDARIRCAANSTDLKEVTYTGNGTYEITDSNENGSAYMKKVSVTVNVPSISKTEEEITYSATANGSYTIEPEVSGEVIKKVDLTVNVKTWESEYLADEARIVELNNEITEKNGQIATLEADVEAKSTQIDNLQSEVATKQETINSLNAELSEKEATIETLNVEISEKDSQIESLTAEVAAKQSEIESLSSQITVLNEEITALNSQITVLNETIASKQSTIESLNGQIATLNADIETLTTEKNALQARLNTITSKTITANGSYVPEEGVEGWNSITVNVPSDQKTEEEIEYSATANGSYTIEPEVSGEVIKKVSLTVNVPTTTTLEMTEEEYEALETKDQNTIYLIQ